MTAALLDTPAPAQDVFHSPAYNGLREFQRIWTNWTQSDCELHDLTAALEKLAPPTPAPKPASSKPTEPISVLLKMPGMTGKQVCRMKGISQDDLLRYCEEHDLPYPGEGYISQR